MAEKQKEQNGTQNSNSSPRNHKIRQSLPVENRTKEHTNYRRTRSHNYGRSAKLMVHKTPPDTIKEEEDTNSNSISIIVEEPSSDSQESSEHVNVKKNNFSFDNPTYEGPQHFTRKPSKASLSVSNNFTREGGSVRSSRHDPSIASMEVQREQYCCFSRWSPCERKLAMIVAILAILILALASVVGYLAGKKTNEPVKFSWSL